MKKAILLFFAVLSAVSLQAQRKHEVNAFIGGYYSEYAKMGDPGWPVKMPVKMSEDSSNDLWDLYEPHYSLKSGPVLTVDYHYILNSFLRVGGQVSYGSLSGKRWYKLGNRPEETIDHSALSVLPELKACIPGSSHFRLYGKAAAGLQYRSGSLAAHPLGFAWEIVPIGAEWGGHRVYGNAEACWGSVIRGGRIGIGFSF